MSEKLILFYGFLKIAIQNFLLFLNTLLHKMKGKAPLSIDYQKFSGRYRDSSEPHTSKNSRK